MCVCQPICECVPCISMCVSMYVCVSMCVYVFVSDLTIFPCLVFLISLPHTLHRFALVHSSRTHFRFAVTVLRSMCH